MVARCALIITLLLPAEWQDWWAKNASKLKD